MFRQRCLSVVLFTLLVSSSQAEPSDSKPLPTLTLKVLCQGDLDKNLKLSAYISVGKPAATQTVSLEYDSLFSESAPHGQGLALTADLSINVRVGDTMEVLIPPFDTGHDIYLLEPLGKSLKGNGVIITDAAIVKETPQYPQSPFDSDVRLRRPSLYDPSHRIGRRSGSVSILDYPVSMSCEK